MPTQNWCINTDTIKGVCMLKEMFHGHIHCRNVSLTVKQVQHQLALSAQRGSSIHLPFIARILHACCTQLWFYAGLWHNIVPSSCCVLHCSCTMWKNIKAQLSPITSQCKLCTKDLLVPAKYVQIIKVS